MISGFDETIGEVLTERLVALEKHFDSDVIFFYGQIQPGMEKFFRNFIEELKEEKQKENEAKNKLVIFLNTPGGSAETVEKLVEIIRFPVRRSLFCCPRCGDVGRNNFLYVGRQDFYGLFVIIRTN